MQDFVYALVKAEMDTDFEDECRDIQRRRAEASDKLKQLDKDSQTATKAGKGGGAAPGSPSKMQVITLKL